MIIDKDNTKLFCYMDDTCCPFNDGECPYPYTKEDEEMIRRIARKYGVAEPEDNRIEE